MDFSLSEDHLTLRAAAQDFLDREVTLAPLLKPGATVADAGYDRLWGKIAELGWPSLIIPEVHGGLGMSYLDLTMIVSEMGRTLAPSPLFGTLAGTFAILAAGSPVQQGLLLGDVAAGSARLALAVSDTSGAIDEPEKGVVAVKVVGGYCLNGAKSFVVDAAAADRIIVAGAFEGEVAYFVVDRAHPGVQVEVLEWRDVTRQVCQVRLSDVPAERLTHGDAQTWPWVRDRLYLVLAAESAAGARAALDDAVEYAKGRVAFGRPIGAYQAIKHQLAEIAGLVECANAGVEYAAWALGEDDPNASMAATMAQSYASEAYREATHRNIQIFGATGFTWEMKNHLFYKRARANAELIGPPSKQREEVISMLEARAAAA